MPSNEEQKEASAAAAPNRPSISRSTSSSGIAAETREPLHASGISRTGGLPGRHGSSSGQSMVMPQGFGQLAFLAAQPQPMSIGRSPPPADHSSRLAPGEIPKGDTAFPFLFGGDNLNTLLQPSVASFAAGFAEIKEDNTFSGSGNFGALIPGVSLPSPSSNNANGPFGSSNSHLGPYRRSHLVNLQEPNSGIFDTGAGLLGVPQLPRPNVPSVAPNLGPLQQPLQLQQLQQPRQPDPVAFSIDIMDMPNDLLSQYLPTAQSLAMENLFEYEANANSLAVATAAIASSVHQQLSNMPPQSQQQQQQQQQPVEQQQQPVEQQQQQQPVEQQQQLQYEQLFLPNYSADERSQLNSLLATTVSSIPSGTEHSTQHGLDSPSEASIGQTIPREKQDPPGHDCNHPR